MVSAWPESYVHAEDIPEADLVMGFENYGQMPQSMRGLLDLGPPTDPFAPLDNQRVQVRHSSMSLKNALIVFQRMPMSGLQVRRADRDLQFHVVDAGLECFIPLNAARL